MLLFSEYIGNLHVTKAIPYSAQLKENAWKRIVELETVIDPEVTEILKKRILET